MLQDIGANPAKIGKNIFDALQLCYGRLGLWHDVSACNGNVLVRNGCIVAKQCEIGPRLLLITNRKSHIAFQFDKKIIDLGSP